jgi:hypothetical protein
MTRQLLIITIVAAAAACASTSSGVASQGACSLEPGDTVFLKGGPVYRDCAVDQHAVAIDRSALPNFTPPPPAGGRACYSAEVEFVVDTEGMPETETAILLHASNPDYGVAAVAVLSRWRYKPAILHGVPVRQIVREKESLGIAVVRVPAGSIPSPPRMLHC